MTEHTIETRKVPLSALRLRGDFLSLKFDAAQPAAADSKPARRRFRLVANTGKPMDLGYYWGKFVIELSGLRFNQRMAVLADHDVKLRVGATDSVKVSEEGLVAEGQMLSNDSAKAILADADDGFPWQASLWLEPDEILVLDEKQKAVVNGVEMEGPLNVARSGLVREVSFVALGADNDATAEAKAGAELVELKFSRLREEPMAETKKDDGKPVTLTAAEVQKQFPAQIAELCASAAEAAVTAERDRTATLLSACDGSQLELVVKLHKEGVAGSDGVLKLNADLRTKLAAKAAGTLGGEQTIKSLGAGNTGHDADLDPEGKVRASFPQDERGTKAYEAWKARARQRA